jgi:thiol-disulfide isomerase/thioredoxin
MKTILLFLVLLPGVSRSQLLQLNEPFPVSRQIPELRTALELHTGKPIILDLFSSTCTSCFTAMPKLQSLQQHFGDQLQIILVGHTDQKIQKVYERIAKHYGLNFPVVYDSLLHPQTGAGGFPTCIWIDRDGITQGITYSTSITKETLKAFIEGTPPKKEETDIQDESSASDTLSKKRYLIQNGISIWQPGDFIKPISQVNPLPDTLYISGFSLVELYRTAFTGEMYWSESSPKYLQQYSLPMVDSAGTLVQFRSDTQYSYLQILTSRTVSDSVRFLYMKQDLERLSGYKATIEERMVPYWRLRVINRNSFYLQSKGGRHISRSGPTGFTCQNAAIQTLIHVLHYYHPFGPIFVDETKIKGNIDLTLDAVMSDVSSIQQALKSNNLTLEMGKRKMKVIVLYP